MQSRAARVLSAPERLCVHTVTGEAITMSAEEHFTHTRRCPQQMPGGNEAPASYCLGTLLVLDLNNVVVHTRLIQREGVANARLGQAHVVVETTLDDLGVFLVVLLIDFGDVIAIYASWVGNGITCTIVARVATSGRVASKSASTSRLTTTRKAHAIALENYCRIAKDARVLAALYDHSRAVGRVLIDHCKVDVGLIRSA